MTLPGQWPPDPGEQYEEMMTEQLEPAVVNVRVMHDETIRVPPEFASCVTFPVPVVGAGSPVQILQRRYHRYKAKFLVNFPAAGTLYINTKFEQLTLPSPQGIQVVSAGALNNFIFPEYESMQPMWVIGSIAGITIGVMDESYGQVQ
jgi:hypothetical protein